MFFHFLSFSIIFVHFLSCSFIFVHVLSFYDIFFHVLSCSFMFFHFLSCSLSLLGAQNLIFLGLHFVTISLDSSSVKNQFLGPSRVVFLTPLGPLFLFFPIFCSTVFCLFFAFYIFTFDHFLFISFGLDRMTGGA